jgi:hypothetical protein
MHSAKEGRRCKLKQDSGEILKNHLKLYLVIMQRAVLEALNQIVKKGIKAYFVETVMD